MDSQLRPLGLVYTAVGGILLTIGMNGIQGAGTELLDWIKPVLLIGFGLQCGHLGTRFGGMNWLPQLLLIGLMFLWGAFRAHDSFDRWFGFWMGGMFALSAGVAIIATVFAHGLGHALLQPTGKVIVVAGRGRRTFTAASMAEAIREASEPQQGTDSPPEDPAKLT